MKKLWLLLLVPATLLSAGCRQDPYMTAVFESMNSEKRMLEDRIYELQDETEMLDDQLESTRRENNKLRKEIRGGEDDETDTSRPDRARPPRSILPGTRGAAPDPEAPMIDLGTPEGAAPRGAGSTKPAPGLRNLEMNGPAPGAPEGAPNELPAPVIDEVSYEEPADDRVTHIVLNPFLTGGHDFDHKPGDDGVAVIIEPRNAEDQFVAQAGPISIVVIDLAKEGPEARLARWDFDSVEAGKRLKKTRIGRGIHLKLPWPNEPPEGNKIRIFVRYETLDGLKLEADREVVIALPGQYSQRWTPRPDESFASREAAKSTSSVLVGHQEEVSSESGSTATFKSSPHKKGAASSGAPRRPSWQPNR